MAYNTTANQYAAPVQAGANTTTLGGPQHNQGGQSFDFANPGTNPSGSRQTTSPLNHYQGALGAQMGHGMNVVFLALVIAVGVYVAIRVAR